MKIASAWLLMLALVLAAGPNVSSAQSGGFEAMTAAQWHADVRLLAEQMPKVHQNLFHTMTRAQFDDAVRAFDGRIDTLNVDERLVGFARLTALVQDGHSGSVGPLEYGSETNYPLRLVWYPSGIYVRSAPPAFANAVGARVVRVGHASVEDAYEAVREIVPHDPGNDGRVHIEGTVLYLTSSRVLHGLGLTDTSGEATYVVERDGRRQTLALHPGATALQLMGFVPPAERWIDAADASASPASLRHSSPGTAYSFQYLADSGTMYVRLASMQNRGPESLEAFFARVFAFTDSHDVRRFILDLRDNGGGNTRLSKPVVLGLVRAKNIDVRGKLFALIGPQTFSAAQYLVNRLEAYTETTFVGSPTGENPSFYADTKDIVLPNSGLYIGMSSVYWQAEDPRDVRTSTGPMFAVDETMDAYRQNADPAIQEIIAGHVVSLGDAISEALPRGYAPTRAAYDAWVHDSRHRYAGDAEPTLVALGHRFLNEKRPGDAVIVLRIDTAEHANSSGAFHLLGDAAAAAGNDRDAIAAYARAVQLDPTDYDAAGMLRTLRSKQPA